MRPRAARTRGSQRSADRFGAGRRCRDGWTEQRPGACGVLDPRRPWTGRCLVYGGAVPKPLFEKLAGEEG